MEGRKGFPLSRDSRVWKERRQMRVWACDEKSLIGIKPDTPPCWI